MKLDEYLAQTGESERAFAKRARVESKSLARIRSGSDAFGETWARIASASGGAVRRADYFDEPVVCPARVM